MKQKIISASLIIGYFLFPFDIIPDFLTMIGVVDDIGVLLIVLQQIIKMAPAELREKHKIE
ncbi:YkvA family protein [Mesobacillus subterraneus]|uniref:YkvA family protein n=1 Tax=Mesobacillus subterraneus TaxID=285983 RepID=UPI003D66E298